MSTVREKQQGINRERRVGLIQQRQQRALNRWRKHIQDKTDTDDLEHDAEREWELIEGTKAEQETEQDERNKNGRN